MCTSILDGGDNKKGERKVEEQRCMYFFIKLLSSDSNMPLDKFFHQIQRTCLKAFGSGKCNTQILVPVHPLLSFS
jgi:hypothetical protein